MARSTRGKSAKTRSKRRESRSVAPDGLRILLCNDDGVSAPGLRALERIAKEFSSDVWTVAPESQQSAASHNFTMHLPLRMRKLGPRRFCVDGTPTDCIFVALRHIFEDRPPDLVLSGVNSGENLGEDITYSGTIAGAIEATLLGIPAVALSQTWPVEGQLKWKTAEVWAPRVLRKLLDVGWPRDVVVSVNFPDVVPDAVTGIVAAPQGRHAIGDVLDARVDSRGAPYFWRVPSAEGMRTTRLGHARRRGTDLDVVFNRNAVAVTPLELDLTHGPTLRKFRTVFD